MEFGICIDIKTNKIKSKSLTIKELQHECLYRKMLTNNDKVSDSYLYFLVPVKNDEDEIVHNMICRIENFIWPNYYLLQDFINSKFIEASDVDSVNLKIFQRYK